MPTYEYKCRKCQRVFEVFQSMKDQPLATCDACGGKVKRLIGTGAGIIFKGSGFYCTDYEKPTGAPAGGAKDKEAPAAPAAESAKSTATEKTGGETKKNETAKTGSHAA